MKIKSVPDFAVQKMQKRHGIPNYSAPITSGRFALKHDTISFGRKFPMNVEDTTKLAKALSESTSGVRKIGDAYREMIAPLTEGVMAYCAKKGIKDIVLAHDTRAITTVAGRKITETLINNGFNVHIDTKGLFTNKSRMNKIKPVSTPLLAAATQQIAKKTGRETFGILLTPSHNPWTYGGFNLVTAHATIAPASITDEIGKSMIAMAKGEDINTRIQGKGKVKRMNPLQMYNKFINKNVGFDWKAIRAAKVPIIYEDMNGAGKTCFPQFMEKNGVKVEKHLSSEVSGPNPVDKNLTELKKEVEAHKSPFVLGLANDGDADRFGVVYKDEKGKAQFMSPNDVILLVGHHMFQNRGLTQTPNTVVIMNHATSPEVAALARKHGAETIQTPVGFKYIAEDFVELSNHGKKVVIAGEESAGLTVHGDIPEKDGLVALAMLTELVAKEKKPLGVILKDVKKGLGVHYSANLTNFEFGSDEQKNATVGFFDKHLKGEVTEFAGFKIDTAKTQAHNAAILKYKPSGDGTKLFLEGGSEVLLRKSGTEPIVRAYVNAAGKTPQEASDNYKVLSGAMNGIVESNGGHAH